MSGPATGARATSRRPRASPCVHGLGLDALGLGLTGCAVLSSVIASRLGYRPAAFDVEVERGVELTTADGMRLVSDIFRPRTPERTPTILVRIPLDRTLDSSHVDRHPNTGGPASFCRSSPDERYGKAMGGSPGQTTWATMAPMILRRSLTVLVVLVLATLGPLASASPPDPSWIGGFYDAADGDDAILAVTGMDSPPLTPIVAVESHAVRLGDVAPTAARVERAFALAAPAVRAPPSA